MLSQTHCGPSPQDTKLHHGENSVFCSHSRLQMALSHTLTHTHTHSHTLSHTLTHTHTFSRTLTHSHTLNLPLLDGICLFFLELWKVCCYDCPVFQETSYLICLFLSLSLSVSFSQEHKSHFVLFCLLYKTNK